MGVSNYLKKNIVFLQHILFYFLFFKEYFFNQWLKI